MVDLRKARDQPLPAHAITSGDIIGVSESSGGGAKQISSGVVTSVTQMAIVASFDESGESLELSSDGVYRAVKLANDVTYRRLKAAIDRLDDPKSNTILTNCLFGTSTLSPALQTLNPKISKEDGDINYVNGELSQDMFDNRSEVTWHISLPHVCPFQKTWTSRNAKPSNLHYCKRSLP